MTGALVDGGDVAVVVAAVVGSVEMMGFTVFCGRVTGLCVDGGDIRLSDGEVTGVSNGSSSSVLGVRTGELGTIRGMFDFSFGGLIPGPVLILTEASGMGTIDGVTVMSLPLQPSGKKYLIFLLRCSSSLKSPTKDACLKLLINSLNKYSDTNILLLPFAA